MAVPWSVWVRITYRIAHPSKHKMQDQPAELGFEGRTQDQNTVALPSKGSRWTISVENGLNKNIYLSVKTCNIV